MLAAVDEAALVTAVLGRECIAVCCRAQQQANQFRHVAISVSGLERISKGS